MAVTSGTGSSLYEAIGGEETFRRLVSRFYQLVGADPLLRPVYPSRDLGPAEEHLRLFLIPYWGGPQIYSEQRGHPRLRMRHSRFKISEAERDAWLRHMRTALDELGLDEAHDAQLWDYLVMAARMLVNQLPRMAAAGQALAWHPGQPATRQADLAATRARPGLWPPVACGKYATCEPPGCQHLASPGPRFSPSRAKCQARPPARPWQVTRLTPRRPAGAPGHGEAG